MIATKTKIDWENLSTLPNRSCEICGKSFKKPTISLPKLPLTEIYTKTKPRNLAGFVDQVFYFCESCQHGQLGFIIPPEILYTKASYFFRPFQSKTSIANNDVLINFIKDEIGSRKFKSIIEIGAIDLNILEKLKEYSESFVAIDPLLKKDSTSTIFKKTRFIDQFIEQVNFNEGKLSDSLVISSHTLEHLTHPKKVLHDLMEKSSENTLFSFQFPGLDTLLFENRFDQIFHQHVHYFSLFSFQKLLENIGAELLNYSINYLHWGTMQVLFRKKTSNSTKKVFRLPVYSEQKIIHKHQLFKKNMKDMGVFINSIKSQKLYGFGAALMLPVLGYYLNTDFSEFSGILDDDSQKKDLYYINLAVKIGLPPDSLSDAAVVITATNTTRSVLPRVLSLSPKRIIFPIQTI